MYGLSITLIIVVVNTILKLVITKLVNWIGIDTVSKQMGIITKAVFMAQFFNTGIIILIVNANMIEHEPKEIFGVFRGPYADYTPIWFIEVGMKIIVTYFVQGLLPFIKLGTVVIKSSLKIYYDTKFTGNRYKTRQSTMQKYKLVYDQGQFPIHLHFSEALNIVFLAMTYGLGMPIMFPMAAIIIAN